jgi:hypothetical protein
MDPMNCAAAGLIGSAVRAKLYDTGVAGLASGKGLAYTSPPIRPGDTIGGASVAEPEPTRTSARPKNTIFAE